MSIITSDTPKVKPADAPVNDPWEPFDGFTWELGADDDPAEIEPTGPSADDERWAAEHLNPDWHHFDDCPPDDWDRWAEQAEADAAYERGLLWL